MNALAARPVPSPMVMSRLDVAQGIFAQPVKRGVVRCRRRSSFSPRAMRCSSGAFLISVMNSWRVSTLVRNTPSIAEVVTQEFCFSTPRIRMHRCSASSTTATPKGLSSSIRVERDLGRHPLLDLEAAGVDFDQPRQLRQPDDVMARQVGDMRLAHEGQQVMLAQGIEVNVPADDHLLVVLLDKQRAVDHRLGVLPITAGQEVVGLDYPGWGAAQSLRGRDPRRYARIKRRTASCDFFCTGLQPFSIQPRCCYLPKETVHRLLRKRLGSNCRFCAAGGRTPGPVRSPAKGRHHSLC